MTSEKVEIFKVVRYLEDGLVKYAMELHNDVRVIEVEEIIKALTDTLHREE